MGVREIYGRSDYAIIGELIEPGTRVLDLGCGEGLLLAWLKENKQVNARGVELITTFGSAPASSSFLMSGSGSRVTAQRRLSGITRSRMVMRVARRSAAPTVR